ncbi:tripartite tricarboxylate transporter substrate binding protein [Cryobacterium sp. PH29-G1]|uniref:tripartite tricarboxylate transporter substrate binding protein n=1 Tax=Cryobacterium sp. PH29-G1 TaxID=3046211 RepID=UPI0024BAF78B|nr:tripartite tricarboxylate transporter substrate binding protein [Cryobacterium sp. PH29-G1]MDJ0350768.1 tripartite tricarboxylate transporter substrate binding protein [Cryobacterium sp. PH29-G1]
MKSTFFTSAAVILSVGVAVSLTGCGAAGTAEAVDAGYPAKTVKFLMPYAAGGPSDVTSRAMAQCLSQGLGGTFVVENQSSGAGAVAMQQLASAKPDGYTVGLSTNGPMVLNPMFNELPYSMDDFTAIGTMAKIPTMFAVGKDSPFKDAESLFQAAQENPGTISMGVPGATSSLAIELKKLQQDFDIEFAVVPTSGSAELITNLLGGHIDAVFINDHKDVAAHVKDGGFVPLAAASQERSKTYADLPTMEELGYEGFFTDSVYGLFGPKGLPDAIVATLESGIEACTQDQEVIDQIGERFVPDTFSNAEETAAVFADMQTRYEPLVG